MAYVAKSNWRLVFHVMDAVELVAGWFPSRYTMRATEISQDNHSLMLVWSVARSKSRLMARI